MTEFTYELLKLYDDELELFPKLDVPDNEPVKLPRTFTDPVTIKLPLIIAEPVYGNNDTLGEYDALNA
jgi:hypothetical protein